MSVRFYAVGLVALAVFAQIPDCDPLSGVTGLTPFQPGAITNAADAATRAAALSSDVAGSADEAAKLREKATSDANLAKLDKMSFTEIDQAIEKMPAQAELHTDRAAMLLAAGREIEAYGSFGRARGIFQAANGEKPLDSEDYLRPSDVAAWETQTRYIASLIKVRKSVPANSEAGRRLDQEICNAYRDGTVFKYPDGSRAVIRQDPGLKCP